MSTKFNLALVSLGFVGLSLTACASSDELEKEGVGTAQQASQFQNGLSANGLSANGLVMQKLSDPYSRQLLEYIINCALPANHHVDLTIDNELVHFYGALGLAPEWEGDNGSCTTTACQTWVSACVLSRLNYYGHHMDISLRGLATGATQGNPGPDGGTGTLGNALVTSLGERQTFSHPEATYFGNLFPNPPVRYACTVGNSTLIERVCGPGSATPDSGPPYANCIVNVLGGCTEGTIPRCEGPEAGDDNYGTFSKCRDTNGTQHVGSITVYRENEDGG